MREFGPPRLLFHPRTRKKGQLAGDRKLIEFSAVRLGVRVSEQNRPSKFTPAVQFDGGDLDCGNGLLLFIRRHIDPLAGGQLLEITSSESSVAEDLPAWCRLTGNELVQYERQGTTHRFLVSRGPFSAQSETAASPSPSS